MSLVDKLHVERSGYRLEVTNTISDIQESEGLFGRDTTDILQDAKDRVDSHKWFDGYHGPIYGEIIEYTNAEPAEICNHEIESDPQDVLKVMAKECMVRDVMIQIEKHDL